MGNLSLITSLLAMITIVVLGAAYLPPGWLVALCVFLAMLCVGASRRSNLAFAERRRHP
ncbi:MAG: hypothetical protein AAF493_17485 [Pseudomonadota bacterium]